VGVVIAVIVGLFAGGCGGDAAADPGVEPIEHDWPAALPGGACTLLNYDAVETATGVRFAASAAAQAEETDTCALTSDAGTFPDLVLAVTPSQVDKASYVATMPPAGSVPVPKLGQAAYRAVTPAKGGAGPQVEVGWLSANGRLMSLRFTFAPGATKADVDGLAAPLVELAKSVDKHRGE
jgi:hypothetical protein